MEPTTSEKPRDKTASTSRARSLPDPNLDLRSFLGSARTPSVAIGAPAGVWERGSGRRFHSDLYSPTSSPSASSHSTSRPQNFNTRTAGISHQAPVCQTVVATTLYNGVMLPAP